MVTSSQAQDLEARRVSQVGLSAIGWALLRHKLARIGVAIIVLLTCMAVFAPLLAPFDPNEQDLYNVLSGPSQKHWRGTDNVGRDLLSRVMYGSRVSMLVGVVATSLSASIGVLVGLVAGYRGGKVDMVVMRITDTFMCIPGLVFVLVMAAALGPGINNVIYAIVALGWCGFARITRGQVLSVREQPFVEAARALGTGGLRIMFRHLLPNSLAPIIVAATLTLGGTIMMEASAAFLGLGVQPPTASWGKELRTGYTYLERVPLFSIAPGLLITAAVLSFNFVGDGLRDALDPRLRGEGKKQ